VREPEKLELRLITVLADKQVYHSAETMNLTLVAWANQDTNATVRISGVPRMTTTREVNLTKGTNQFYVAQRLPRCNVCGGIRPRNYSVLCQLWHGSTELNKTIVVEIRQ